MYLKSWRGRPRSAGVTQSVKGEEGLRVSTGPAPQPLGSPRGGGGGAGTQCLPVHGCGVEIHGAALTDPSVKRSGWMRSPVRS